MDTAVHIILLIVCVVVFANIVTGLAVYDGIHRGVERSDRIACIMFCMSIGTAFLMPQVRDYADDVIDSRYYDSALDYPVEYDDDPY